MWLTLSPNFVRTSSPLSLSRSLFLSLIYFCLCHERLSLESDSHISFTASKPVELPIGHLVSKIHDKIVISCRTHEPEKASKNSWVPYSIFLLVWKEKAQNSKSLTWWTCIFFFHGLSRVVLDVSSMKAGAPGRTRGLKIKAVESFSEPMNGINHLS